MLSELSSLLGFITSRDDFTRTKLYTRDVIRTLMSDWPRLFEPLLRYCASLDKSTEQPYVFQPSELGYTLS
ncbi:hypothetical protein PM082_010398 [Marasmius tenuissimus]|nr:hypothetical protein PM082_010398 [Marasmius tenuissimus]